MDSVNFTANYIKDVKIAKHHYGKYVPCKVSLVEMDSANPRDLNAIYKVTDKWDNSFTAFTYDDMRKVNKYPELMQYLHVYALTTQKTGLDKIKPSKILGVTEIVENYKDGNKIEVLQTNPDMIKGVDNKFPKFKNIGKKLVSYVKRKFGKKPLYLNPTQSAVPFYKKQGFSPVPDVKMKNIFWVEHKS